MSLPQSHSGSFPTTLILQGFRNPEPQLPEGRRVGELGFADASARTVSAAKHDGVGVAADHKLARQDMLVVHHHLVRDATGRIVEILDLVAGGELAQQHGTLRDLQARRRLMMLDHHDQLFGVPDFRQPIRQPSGDGMAMGFDEALHGDDAVELAVDIVAGLDPRLAGRARQDLFRHRHAHR